MSDAFLTLRCPSCGVTSERAPASLAGRRVRCGACHFSFLAPSLPDAPAATVLETADDDPAPTVAEAPDGSSETGSLLTAPTVAEAEVREAPPRTSVGIEWRTGDLVLGLYEVIGVLGEGGMGRVYRVHHHGWDLDLAVKVPLPAVLDEAGGADLFEREAETWVNLGLHPHVVTCYYVRRVEGLPLVFAEYADGGSLHDAIRTGRLDSLEAILDVAIQFAWGLHHAHEQGLVHRDVKPANVMLTSDGFAKVTDFGLARSRAIRLAAPGRASGGRTMTVEGGGGATPAYVSPEQARGETLSRRSDIWSFALSVLEMFAGRRSWDFGLKAPEVLASFRRGELGASGRPALPGPVAELLARCFREKADERPHDLAEVAAALQDSWRASAGTPYARREPRGGRGSADALNNRAASLVDLGRAAEADTLWRRALELDPHHVEATFNATLAAWTEARIGDPELLRRMEEACASHPASARARQLEGRLHLVAGQPAEAAAAFERAVELGSAEDLEHDLERARAPRPAPELVFPRLPETITALTTTPGGPLVASCPGEIRVFDPKSGLSLRTIAVQEGSVRSLLLTDDGRTLVAGLEGAPITVFDLASGRRLRGFARHTGFATSLASLPGGLLLSGGSDRVVRVWDTASGRCLRELSGHEDAVSAVAAGSSLMASAGRDGTVRIWTIADGRCLATLRAQGGRVLALALSESQSRLVAAGDDGVVRDWGLRSHALVRSYASHAQTVQALALAADGGRILSGSSDRTLRGFDAEGERLSLLGRFDSAVQALAVGADGVIFVAHGNLVSAVRCTAISSPPLALCRPASAVDEEARTAFFEERVGEARRSLDAGDFGTAFRLARSARSIPGHERARAVLAVWDDLCARVPRQALLSAWEEARLEGHQEAVLAVALDPAGAAVATASLDGTVRTRILTENGAERVLRGHEGAVTGVAFLDAGSRILSSGRDRTLRLWDAASGTALAVLEGHAETVASVDGSPDGQRAASAGWDGTVRLWDLRSRSMARVLEGHGANVAAVRFSTDGQVLASGGWDGTARLWDPETGTALAVLAGHGGNVTALAFHPTGRHLATGCDDRAVRLFDPRSKRPPRVLEGHTGEVTGLAFTPDGRFLLSSSRDGTVRVWDVRRGETVRSLPHPAMVLGLSLLPAGSLLATACGDRTGRLWHLDWEPEAAATTAPAGPTASIAGTTARSVASAAGATAPGRPSASMITRASTLRADLRRAGPGPVRVLRPKAARAARIIPWRWLGLGALLLLAIAISLVATRRPTPRLHLSRQMAREVPLELDLVDVSAFASQCQPSEYDQHLERLRSGTPDARDIACVATRPSEALVADVLDRAPLTDRDPFTARRLRRNAASALTALGGEALDLLCARLDDARGEARQVAAMALAVARHPAVNECLGRTLRSGTPEAKRAAAEAMRQRITRGLLPLEEGWRLVRQLLDDPDPQTELAGLELVSLYASGVSAPAAQVLTRSPNPQVAAKAKETVVIIAGIRRADQLLGDIGP